MTADGALVNTAQQPDTRRIDMQRGERVGVLHVDQETLQARIWAGGCDRAFGPARFKRLSGPQARHAGSGEAAHTIRPPTPSRVSQRGDDCSPWLVSRTPCMNMEVVGSESQRLAQRRSSDTQAHKQRVKHATSCEQGRSGRIGWPGAPVRCCPGYRPFRTSAPCAC